MSRQLDLELDNAKIAEIVYCGNAGNPNVADITITIRIGDAALALSLIFCFYCLERMEEAGFIWDRSSYTSNGKLIIFFKCRISDKRVQKHKEDRILDWLHYCLSKGLNRLFKKVNKETQ